MKKIFKSKAFKIILIIVIVAALALTAVFVIRNKNKKNTVSEFNYVRTVTLAYSTLQDTIVADGTIESQSTSTITSSVNGATVSKINYSVGDYVEVGDVVVELDTTNLYKQISKQKEQISKKQEQLQETYDDAYYDYADIEEEKDAAKETRNAARDAYEAAEAIVSPYSQAVETAQSNLNNYFNEQMALGRDANDIKQDQAYRDLELVLQNANNNLNEIKKSTNYDSLYKTYESAQNTYSQLKTQLSNAEERLNTASDNLEEGVDTDNLDDLYDDVSDYKIKAKTAGQITSINAVLGANTNGTLATIQDTKKLKISLTIDEYDILSLQLGMKAIIETDASDKTYEGEVAVISPVASSGMGSSGFEIEVYVTSEDVTNLLIGMNAEVTIIVSSGEQNFTVPQDAVETKMDGTKVIYVKNDAGEFEEMTITTGNNNGYYVEIFGEGLKEGLVVRASANADEASISSFEEAVSEEGGFNFFGGGGFSGGNMPSGGGNMPSGGFSGGGNMPSGGGPGGF